MKYLIILVMITAVLSARAERQFFDESIPGLRYSDREEVYYEESESEEEGAFYEEPEYYYDDGNMVEEEFDSGSCNSPELDVDTHMSVPNLSLGYE